jgi:hypothetical protein
MANDMESILIRNSLGSIRHDEPRCSHCRRTPLVGELIHMLDSGKTVCSLCVGELPERDGLPISCERVRSNDRPLAVVRAA